MRIPHSRGVGVHGDTVEIDGKLRRPVECNRDLGRSEGHGTHVTGRVGDRSARIQLEVNRPSSAARVHDQPVRRAEPLAPGEPRQTSDPVPGHLRDRTVGVVERHGGVGTISTGAEQQQAVRTDPREPIAERDGIARVERGRGHKEVISRAVQFGQIRRAHEDHHAMTSSATVSDLRAASNQPIRSSRRNHARWRRPNWRVRTATWAAASSTEETRPSR